MPFCVDLAMSASSGSGRVSSGCLFPMRTHGRSACRRLGPCRQRPLAGPQGSIQRRGRSASGWATLSRAKCQAAEALAAAHAGRVIHRDLKPANLFVQDNGRLKICDFGIAVAADATTSMTNRTYIVGTPSYISPEQWKG